MGLIPFNELPDNARLWTFNAERALSDAEYEQLTTALGEFIVTWAAHRKDLTAGYEVRYKQFVLVGVDESRLPPSGCSIDSLVTALDALGRELGLELIDAPDVTFRGNDGIQAVDRDTFAQLAGQGTVTADTIVFDRTAQRIADVRQGRWERPARESWHARAFDLKTAAPL